jgi:hypothetical protein
MKTTYVPGRYIAICDMCGFRFYNTDLKKDWKGLMVCAHDYEARNQQDLIRVRAESSGVPYSRPESTDLFITNYILTQLSERLITEDGDNLTW